MNFLNLYYFSVAAEELNFTRAAKRLFISQQALSNHISRLENEYQVVLFNRTQPATLTEAGETLYSYSQKLLYQKRQIETAMQDLRDFKSGVLTVGISTSRGSVMLPEILPRFHRLFPQVELRLVEGTTKEINQALYEGRADLNIGFSINDPEHVHEDLLHTEHLVCAVPNSFLNAPDLAENHPLRIKMLQNFRYFKDYPFIKMPCSTWLGAVFERCCQDHQVAPEIVLETTSMTTLVSLCSAGIGAIVLPEIFINRRALFWSGVDWRDSVSIFPLDYPAGTQNITISYLIGHYNSRAALEFIRETREIFTY